MKKFLCFLLSLTLAFSFPSRGWADNTNANLQGQKPDGNNWAPLNLDSSGNLKVSLSGGGGASALGTYLVQTATNAPANSQIMASLATGMVINATTTGVQSIYAGSTCTNQFLSALSSSGAGTCTTDTLAGAQHANQGTTTQVLHGNGAGNPSWASIVTGDVAANAITLALFDASNATANKVLMSGASASPTWSTPTFPNASATSGKTIRSDGTNWIASTATLSDSPSTAGKVMVSDGTNWIASTPTFPNASATLGKFVISDGTNWVASNAESHVMVNTPGAGAAGYGSSNTKIRRFTVTTTNTGSDITYADSATAGGSFTIVNAGYYCFVYTDFNTTGIVSFGLTNNGTHLSSAIGGGTLGAAEILATTSSTAANDQQAVPYCGQFAANDVVRAQVGGTTPDSTSYLSRVDASRVR